MAVYYIPDATRTPTRTPSPSATATPSTTATNTRTPTRTPDQTNCIVISRTLSNLTEGGGVIIYNARLKIAPAAGETVVITPYISLINQVSISPLSRQLNNTNWDTGRNFTISAVDDTVPEVNETGTITHNASSNVGGSPLNGIVACNSMVVNVYDNDGATPTFTRTNTPTPTATATTEGCTSNAGSGREPVCQVSTATPTPTATLHPNPLTRCSSLNRTELETLLLGFGVRTTAFIHQAPTPTSTPIPGRIDWTVVELQQICLSVTHIGMAFLAQSGQSVLPQVMFKEVMGVEENGIRDQGEIELIRANNIVICVTDNNNRRITCGNLEDHQGNPRSITEYVITHEFGHVFDNQAGRGNGRPLRDYIADTSLQATPTTVGTHVNGAIFDTNGNVVMGVVALCGDAWLRGERGWGTGPGSRYAAIPNPCTPIGQLFTNFQQNPAPYGTAGQANEETAADMFLNWVYRKLGLGGFENRDWRPHVTATPTNVSCSQIPGGCDDSNAASGDARNNWMQNVMNEIFAARNWNRMLE